VLLKLPQHPTGSTLERALLALEKMEGKLAAVERAQFEPIAIVGMSCRLAGGVNNPQDLWHLLHAGTDAIAEVPTHRWQGASGSNSAARWAGLLNDVDQFDGEFFGISRNEVADMDPQHRMLLESAWEALEDAGIPPERLVDTKTGVFVGISSRDYFELLSASGAASSLRPYVATGNASSFAAGRLAYLLGLQGPSLCVDTACSSVVVALHLACQSLRRGECETALVGGVNLLLSPIVSSALASLQVLSPDGRCRTFDARANGYVRAEGVGMLVLRRMSDAERRADRIWALVRGSAMNQNGRAASLTAPNVQAQAGVIRAALANARAKPEQIGYVEVHSNGSPFGDPVELDALRAAIGKPRPDEAPCVLGSVKTFLGHSEVASGIASLIKTVLVLNHEVIPRNLHFESLNPNASLDGTPFVIPTRELTWKRTAERRLAGVSATSLSGANAHAILEEPPVVLAQPDKLERPMHVFVLSGKTTNGLRDRAKQMLRHIAAHPDQSLGDQCHTLSAGRSHFEHRFAAVVSSVSDALGQLTDFVDGATSGYVTGRVENVSTRRRVGMIFAGTGSQAVGVLAATPNAPRTSPIFMEALQHADNALLALMGRSVLTVLETAKKSELPNNSVDEELALFILQYALTELWRSWGIEPVAFLGEGTGECVAAWAAGILEFADALSLAAARAHFVASDGRDTDELTRILSRLSLAKPKQGFTPSLGSSYSSSSLATLAYWQAQRTTTVEFLPLLRQHSSREFGLCLEIGPRTGLSAKASAAHDTLPILSTFQRGVPIARSLLETVATLYIHGFEVNWDGFDAVYPYRRISLPSYPFQRQRHWFGRETTAAPESTTDGHPSLGRALEARADRPDVRVWEMAFDDTHHQALGVQCILGANVLSSGGMVQIACAAAREIFGEEAWELGLMLSDPPVIHDDAALTMQVIVTPENDAKANIGVFFRNHPSAQWKPFARGAIQRAQFSDDDDLAPPSMRPGRRQVVAQALWERRLDAFGIDTEVMRFEQIWRREGETLASVVLVKGQAALSFARGVVAMASITHPALHGRWWMIESVEGVTTKVATANSRCWLRLNWVSANGSTARLSAELIDEEGVVAASARNITLRAQDPSAVLRAAGRDPLENAFFDISWKESQLVPMAPPTKRKWIVLTDHLGVGVALAIQLQAAGDAVITLPAAALEQRLGLLDIVLSVSGPFYGVVHLGAMDTPANDALSSSVIDEGIHKGTILAQRIIERLALQSEVPRLWFVTRGAQPVTQTVQSAAQAGLWGLGRVLSAERPDMWGGLVDLDSRVCADDAVLLAQALVAMGSEDHVALRGGKFYVARLVRTTVSGQQSIEIRTDRSYLVTGARTPFGASVVQWLADRGARSLILVHRDTTGTAASTNTLPTYEYRDNLAQPLRSLGIEVIESDVDVSNVDELRNLLSQSRVPLGGIMHTTGVIDEGIGRLTGPDASHVFQQNILAKSHALLALHAATTNVEQPPIDLFVTFASVPAWLGWEGLGADSVIAAVADAIMHMRRQDGLPATCLHLSFANGSRPDSVSIDNEVLAAGFQGMPIAYSLQAMEKVVAQGQSVATATWADWDLFEHTQAARKVTALFAGITAGRRARTGAATLHRRVASVEPEQAQRMVENIVRGEVARILGTNSSEIISNQYELTTLGLDSIMTVQVLTSVNSMFGVTLPTDVILKRPTIESLAARIIQAIRLSQLSLFDQSAIANRRGLLMELNRTGGKPPFFFTPPSFGTGVVYRALVERMSKDRPFYSFSAPGVDDDQQPCERVETLATRFIESMRQVQPRGPYRLGGYSLGALVAYEMAQMLNRAGERVDILVLGDLPPSRFSRSDPSLLGRLAEIVTPLELDVPAFLSLSPDDQIAHMAIALGKLINLPPDVAESGRLLRVYRAHLNAVYHYCPESYDGKVVVIGAHETLKSLAQMDYLAGDPTMGWHRLCSQPVETHEIPGDHVNVVTEPYVIQFARVLQSVLDAVDAS